MKLKFLEIKILKLPENNIFYIYIILEQKCPIRWTLLIYNLSCSFFEFIVTTNFHKHGVFALNHHVNAK